MKLLVKMDIEDFTVEQLFVAYYRYQRESYMHERDERKFKVDGQFTIAIKNCNIVSAAAYSRILEILRIKELPSVLNYKVLMKSTVLTLKTTRALYIKRLEPANLDPNASRYEEYVFSIVANSTIRVIDEELNSRGEKL